MSKKNIIILDHKGGRLCNQLWNYISVYAYCLEKNYQCHNYSFYKYDGDFDIKDKGLLYKIFLLLNTVTYILGKNRFVHKLYREYVNRMETKYGDEIVDSGFDAEKEGVFYLPPTKTDTKAGVAKIEAILNEKNKTYLEGWLFRNPVGIEKYRKEIREYFMPKKHITEVSEKFIESLRVKYKYVVGVHIRQGDYKKEYRNGELYYSEYQVNKFLRKYLTHFNKSVNETCFLVCSDGPVNLAQFADLQVMMGPGDVIEDLHALSLTDTIIGSDSTFGAFASYYGNIPFIVFEKNIDWDYYEAKNKYFENPKCTTVHF